MNNAFALFIFFISSTILAQKPCEYSTNVKDSLGTYKVTKECMMYEKNFAGNISYIFYSLVSTNGTPSLNVQLIQKSKDFIKANCFDKNSKLLLQLNNGKIVTLVHIDQENCGTMLRDDKGFDNRVLAGNFLFVKGTLEDLKKSPVNLMRIKSLTSTEDYVIPKALQSEMNNEIYRPETFFIDNLHCVEN